MNSKITIVTPSYNNGLYIEDAIKSVMDQGYSNFEHIIIDGGSNDNTIEILKKYSHLKWVSESDDGQSDALNKGFRMATGDIIGWLNADDYYMPDTFQKVIARFENNAAIDFFYGEYQYVSEQKEFIRRVKNCRFDRNMLYFYGCYIPSTSSFFRRRIFEDGIYIDKNLKIIMDKDFFTRIAISGYKIGFIPHVLASFRLREDNVGNVYEHLWEVEKRDYLEKYNNYFCKTDYRELERKIRWYYYLLKRQFLKYILDH